MPLPNLARLGRRAVDMACGTAPFYLVSAGGQPNYGDEFITRAWLEYLARAHPLVDVWLDSPEPGRAAHLFHKSHPRLRTTNTLWQLAHLPEKPGPHGAEIIDHVVQHLGSPKIDAGLLALRGVRSIHLLGGGYINSLWPRHVGLLVGAAAMSRHFDVPVFATGQGWMPQEPDARDLIRRLLGDLAFVEARDSVTAREFDVKLGLDDAYLAFARRPKRLYRDRSPDVMLLVQGDLAEQLGRDESIAVLEDFLTQHARGASVGVAEAIPPEDSWLLEGIRALRPDAEFFSFGEIWGNGFPARAGQKWLTTRFHAHLVAAAAGAEGVAFNAVPGYYDIKHQLLIENGTGWTYASSVQDLAQRMPAPTFAPDFTDAVRDYAAAKLAVADRLYRRRR